MFGLIRITISAIFAYTTSTIAEGIRLNQLFKLNGDGSVVGTYKKNTIRIVLCYRRGIQRVSRAPDVPSSNTDSLNIAAAVVA